MAVPIRALAEQRGASGPRGVLDNPSSVGDPFEEQLALHGEPPGQAQLSRQTGSFTKAKKRVASVQAGGLTLCTETQPLPDNAREMPHRGPAPSGR